MKARIILAINSIILLLSGCMIPPQPDDIKIEGMQPKWATQIGKAGIWNNGLVGLPIYNDVVLFHSTEFTTYQGNVFGDFEEDNRINALDINTGEVRWTFPTEYSKEHPMFFNTKPYYYNNYLVVKMPVWGTRYKGGDILLCIDMATGKEKWKKVIPKDMSYKTNNDVIGIGKIFYFTQETEKEALICKGDIESGNWEILSTIKAEEGEDVANVTTSVPVISTIDGVDFLITGGYENKFKITEQHPRKSYLYFVNTNNGNVNKVFFKEGIVIGNFNLYLNKLYFTSGRNAFCYDLEQNQIQWHFFSNEAYNYMAPSVIVSNDIVFLHGDNRFIGLSAKTGEKLYQSDIECGSASVWNDSVCITSRDGNIYIVDIKTGRQTLKIEAPKNYESGAYFATITPRIYNNKLFCVGRYHAYCYDLKELE